MTPALSRGITHANVLMTLLIVCMHAIWTGETRLLPFFVLTNAAVPVFFTISSLLYFQHWKPTWTCYRRKLVSRVRSLLVPYLLYNVLFYLYYIVKIHVLHRPTAKVIPTDIAGALLCIVESVPDGVLWYVRDVFLFALIAPLLGLLLQRSRLLVWILIIASLGCFVLPYENLFFWTPCLLAGCYCALYPDNVRFPFDRLRHDSRMRWLAGALLIAVVACACLLLADVSWSSLAFYLFRMSSPLWMAAAFCIFGALLPQRLVSLMAPLTFFIYCTHPAFVDVAKAVIPMPSPADGLAIVIMRYVLVVLVALLPMTVCGIAIRRLMPRLWALLTGFRSEHR